MKELWKDITGYEGLYQVSNTGKVRSINRTIIDSNGNKQKWKSHIFIGKVNNSGYLTVCLRKCGKRKGFLIHRLVATAFIENPTNLPYVNHKDEDKLNNRVWNLEWCTPKYNANYGHSKEKMSKTHLNHHALSKKVQAIDTDGNVLMEFPSIHDAARQTGIRDNNISRCCNELKYYKTAGGYIWRFKDCTL